MAVGHQVSLERAIHGRALSLVLRFVLLLLRMSEIRRWHSFHLLHKKTKTISFILHLHMPLIQGGRTWQAFGGAKNGHETFRQARIYNFRNKCVVFARNLKFSNLTQ